MGFWSLVFFAIAVIAALVSFSNDGDAVTIARVLFGVALMLFAILVIAKRNDRDDRDGHHDA